MRLYGEVHLAIAAVALLAACTTNPPVAAPTHAPEPPVTSTPAATPTRPETPAPDARLVRRRAEPLNGRGYAALGLTGANKPNGLEYRIRQEVPADRPAYVRAELEGLQLFIADRTADGWLAFYRGPLGGAPNGGNVAYRAILYRPDGSRAWDTNLNRFLSRTDRLEVQDIRYADGKLYFNEACQSYAREAGGACSSLLRVDPAAGTTDWRTPPLTSNNVILLHGPYIVAGYGFTAEADSLFLIDRATGRILDRQPLDSAHSYLEMRGDDLVVVTTNQVYVFGIERR
ncbi:hypothetical protein [Longimicrobium sp.]|uniref:hypothetical protein n=1 Tax=Longimicrobium sp. TaxID=2029185 RepID=UPI002E36C182|nr:hypothetical protein [Longimicrobium sp.]HEX6038054.1 hypothetical protein [Longimicrobium sp.]